MTLERLLAELKTWPASRIVWATLVVTQVGCAFMVAGMSFLFHRQVRMDFMVTGAVTGFLISLLVAVVLSKLIQELTDLAQHDALTGLPNRAMFFERLRQALAIAKRNNTKFALMFIDLDHFKPINDLHGHSIGDIVLQQAGECISGCLRNSDIVGRVGGDEFVVLLPDASGDSSALTVAEKIRVALNQAFDLDGKSVSISSSIGVALYPEHGTDQLDLAERAEAAMYEVKRNGGNSVRFSRSDASQ